MALRLRKRAPLWQRAIGWAHPRARLPQQGPRSSVITSGRATTI